ncbi:MAG TPA: hypothetical protein VL550_08570 [Rhodocyclaceae bacterium]|jgi:hypothetical protein|nr:hypothetical protein [Rhodocyclaceae bacterium]
MLRLSPRLILLLPGILALLFYLPAIGHGYVWDDTYFLRDMPYLRDPALWWKTLSQPLFVSHNYFRPLPLLMFVAESQFHAAGVFHLVNILLHVVNTTLVALLARSLLPGDARGRWRATLAACVYALHPALVENVCWISDRFDLLMTTFILLALWIETRRFALRDIVLGICLLGALLSKETGIVLLALLPLWQCAQLTRASDVVSIGALLHAWWRAHWRKYVAMLLALLVYFTLRFTAFGFLFRGDTQMHPGDAVQHLLLIGKTVGWYCSLLLFPFGRMAPVHPGSTPILLSDIGAWLGLLLIAAMLVFVWRRRNTPAAWLLLMLLVAIAPQSNLLPLTIGDNIVHDRYLILPVACAALLLAHALRDGGEKPLRALGIWLMAAGVCVMLIVPHWRSEATLWTWAYEQHPESEIASGNYLAVLVNAQRNDEALAMCDRLMAWPKYRGGVLEMRALLLWRQQRFDAAAAAVQAALTLPSEDNTMGRLIRSDYFNLLAQIDMDRGRWADAERDLQASLQLTPYYARSYYIQSIWYYRRGRTQEGDASMQTMRRYALPEYAAAYAEAVAALRELSVNGKADGLNSEHRDTHVSAQSS